MFADERIDALPSQNIQIIQSPSVFSFSLDAVLLADFANLPKHGQIVDLCAGNGAVGLFISGHTQAKIIGIELQPELADMGKRSITLNALDDQLSMLNLDLKDTFSQVEKDSCNVVLCNPPYFPDSPTSHKNPNQYLAIARHEITTNLQSVVDVASGLLKMNGKFYLVHRPDRLAEILDTLTQNRLAPKRIRFVHPKSDREANMVLIEAIKDGGLGGVRILPPLTVYDQADNYLPEVRRKVYGDSEA